MIKTCRRRKRYRAGNILFRGSSGGQRCKNRCWRAKPYARCAELGAYRPPVTFGELKTCEEQLQSEAVSRPSTFL
ncbi:hypothetical protein KCP73_13720 [Salmonella enterica subsp. enterica]|nr:hypothetical protein KCP73_13720 [Salmonella enterica subsp. enterica]